MFLSLTQTFFVEAMNIILVLALLVGGSHCQQIINGQVYTPGIAIVNAPQPNTPLGGGKSLQQLQIILLLTSKDTLHISLDVTSNGQLQLPPYPNDSSTAIHNITIFLSSYITGRNFTVTNGTASANNASLGDIMFQEDGSTVKHINWVWPACFVGDGAPLNNNSDRSIYNVCGLAYCKEREQLIHQ